MRKILLLISFFCLPLLVIGQSQKNNSSTITTSVQKIVKIYPNPAFNFIGLNNIADVGSIIIYNLVGRKMKKFIPQNQKGEQYDIADLPRGMYLVQLLGKDGKVVTTQRMSKK